MKLCFVVLYAYVASTLLLQCDARNARHFKASSHTRRGFTVVEDSAYKILRPLKRLGVDPVVEQSAAADSPFSLPPLDDSYGYEAPLVMPKNGPPFCVNPPSVPTLTPPPTSPPTSFLFPGPPPPPSELSSPVPPIYFPSPPGLPNPPEYVPSPPGYSPSPPVEYMPTPPSLGASPPEGYAPTPPSVGASPPEGYAPTPPEGYVPGPPEGYVPGPPPEGYVPGPPEGYVPGPPPEGYVPGPPEGYEPTPPEFVPGPPYFLPPVVFPPPAKPPPYSGPGITLWCVAKPTVPDPIVQEAMNYACGSGADCHSIQPEGTCYQPDTLLSHASFAFNSYWQRTKANGGTCDFGGTAMLITQDPSFDGCRFIYY